MRTNCTGLGLSATLLLTAVILIGCQSHQRSAASSVGESEFATASFDGTHEFDPAAVFTDADTVQFDLTFRHAALSDTGERRVLNKRRYTVFAQSPNLLRIEHSASRVGERSIAGSEELNAGRGLQTMLAQNPVTRTVNVVSDGSRVYLYSNLLHEYYAQRAPKNQCEAIAVLSNDAFGWTLNAFADALLLPVCDDQPPICVRAGSDIYAADGLAEFESHFRKPDKCNHPTDTEPDDARTVWLTKEGNAGHIVPLAYQSLRDVRPFQHERDQIMRRLNIDPEDESVQPLRSTIAYESTLYFSNWRINEPIDADHFRFDQTDYERAKSLNAFLAGPAREREQAPPPTELIGSDRPDLPIRHLTDETFDPDAATAGRAIILDFWATWCGPCIRAMPDLIEVQQEYADHGVRLFAVNVGESAEHVRSFIEDQGWQVDVLMDKDHDAAQAFGVQAFPTTIIIDPDGVIRAAHQGYSPELQRILRDELDAILREISSESNR